MIQEHNLKVATEYFDAVAAGDKNFEVRRDDRGFQRGDVLVLRRYGSSSASNRAGYLIGTSPATPGEADTVRRKVTYVLTGGQFGIQPGYVILGLSASLSLHESAQSILEALDSGRGGTALWDQVHDAMKAEQPNSWKMLKAALSVLGG